MPFAPFSLFSSYADKIQILLFHKSDAIESDQQVAKAFKGTDVAALHQVHGNHTIVTRSPIARDQQADGLLTDTPNLVLSTRWADCQNFVLYAPGHHVCGVLHAGWKGLLTGAIPAWIRTLQEEWGIHPSQCLVGAGPSLCQQCAGFTDPLTELPGIDPQFFDGRFVDLQGIANQQLLDAGILPEHFERHADCTRCKPESYWTYRGGHKEEVQQGRTNVLACSLLSP